MYTIGIDVGGMSFTAGVITKDGTLLSKATRNTPQSTDPQIIADELVTAAKAAVQDAGVCESEIKAIGLGIPGSVDPVNGDVIFACNIPAWANNVVPLTSMMRKQWDIPVILENDANAAALGEALAGGAKGYQDVLFITIGTGVGGGIIIGGKVQAGFNHVGGEVGHMVIVHNGEPCGCGRKGCWESYASATALMRYTREAMQNNPDSAMWKYAATLDDVTGRTSFDAMRDDDSTAQAVVDHYIEMLGCGLASMINILMPEVICLGGGIANEGDTLITPLTKVVLREAYNQTSKQTQIRKACLGNNAGIIGAGLRAFDI